jgi:hypothetical protein
MARSDSRTPFRIIALIGVSLSVLVPHTAAAQELGRIVYLEGDVQLLRDGESRDAFSINPGEVLMPLDVIQTGFDGYVEVELDVPSAATIRVRENAAYYAEPVDSGGNPGVRVRLLTGRIEMNVAQLTRGSSLTVETQTAVLGVRGTEFDVITSPDDAVLFGIREGQVEIEGGGSQTRAGAGTVVELQTNQRPRTVNVPENQLEDYYADWTEIRLQAFRSGAPTFVRAYARRYLDTRDTFESAYRELVVFRPRLEEAEGSDGGSLGGDMRLRSEISPAIIRMRSIFPLFEMTVYRLRELQRFHSQGIGRTRIGDIESTEFFRTFADEERVLLLRLAEVRTIFRLYGAIEERSFGGLPSGDSPFGGGESLLDSMRF